MQNYSTDKFSHGYIPVYEKYFEQFKNVKNILEIGVLQGESLKYFNDYFPNATIYGIDIEDKKHFENDKIKTFICNQESRDDLNYLMSMLNIKFEIILDDGGHTMKQQQTSFGVLFNHLINSGIYILEDLHTSRMEKNSTRPVNENWIFDSDYITTLDMLFNLKYTNNLISNHITDEEKKYITKNIDSIEIWSKNIEYNQSVTSIIKKINL
jgi:hypothetical protein